MADLHAQASDRGFSHLALRMLGALGVVYGDIGTSVLYAMQECFFAQHPLERNLENVLGILSFFFWSMFLVIGVKYIFVIMRAHNRGEGGDFALLALLKGARSRVGPRKMALAMGLVTMGAALLLADGMITPAISILSAVEGLGVLASFLDQWVVLITVVILLALFSMQAFGTEKIGRVFGPTMVMWFGTIAILGIVQIWQCPVVLQAVNPMHLFRFIAQHGYTTFYTLGAVVLCLTGGEALYADMGHFGQRPIRMSWWTLVFPALLLNYFGQGAFLLRLGAGNPVPGGRLFYSLIPAWGLIPLIVLATAATIIASQALISGAFSIIQQAIALGVFPRQRIVHTNAEVEGQIYLPFVNWGLMAGCVTLVVLFKTSGALAAAYGIAVTCSMMITTVVFYLVARHLWKWNVWWLAPACLFFFLIDFTFFGANLLKVFDGGYVPILIALGLFCVMHSWSWGRTFIAQCYLRSCTSTLQHLIHAKANPKTMLLRKSLVVLASRPVSALTDTLPPALQSRLDHLGAIYKHVTILSVIQHPGVREIRPENRFIINELQNDPERGTVVTVQIFFGYMQDPDLSHVLEELRAKGVIRASEGVGATPFTILSGSERLIDREFSLFDAFRIRIFRILLRNANAVLRYFNLEFYPDVSTEVVTLGKDTVIESWLASHEAPITHGPLKTADG